MEPVFVLFWATMAVLGGYLAAHIARAVSGEWDISGSAAVLTSFVAIGLFLGSLAGNPWVPTLITWALTGGLAWACLDWDLWECAVVKAVTRTIDNMLVRYTGNHERHTTNRRSSWRERWSARLARWGFPSQQQMEWERLLRRLTKPAHNTNSDYRIRERFGMFVIDELYIEYSTRYVSMYGHPALQAREVVPNGDILDEANSEFLQRKGQ